MQGREEQADEHCDIAWREIVFDAPILPGIANDLPNLRKVDEAATKITERAASGPFGRQIGQGGLDEPADLVLQLGIGFLKDLRQRIVHLLSNAWDSFAVTH